MITHTKPVLTMLGAMVLATMACSVSIPGLRVSPDFLPQFGSYKTGELQEEELLVESREETVDVALAFGAGQITVSPGSDALLSGTARYNVAELAPDLVETANRVSLSTGELNLDSFPTNIEGDVINEWDLALGSSPVNLDVDIGAAQADLDLGGLSLQNLTMDVGAADLTLDFSSPNRVEMDRLDLECGASSADLRSLANANARTISINAAGGDFSLDFSGNLSLVRDLYVEVSMAAGHLRIVVPADAAVELHLEGAMMDVDTYGEWQRDGSVYSHKGDGGVIELNVNAGAGQVELYID